ncbi:MAG: hypothetical protein Q8L98_00930 [Chlamydiales bacterium]|nr:hypothetical protein [Chlamydiales bacterium]
MTIEWGAVYQYRYSNCDDCGISIEGKELQVNFRPDTSQVADCMFPNPFQGFMSTNWGLIIKFPNHRTYRIDGKGEFLIKLEPGRSLTITRCDNDGHLCREPEE